MEKGKNKHRGAILAAAVKETGANISRLVERMGIARGTFYNHKADPHLSLEYLARYGKYLKYDFSTEVPEMKKFNFEESDVPYGTPKTLEEAIEQRDYWRERYYKKHEELVRVLAEDKK